MRQVRTALLVGAMVLPVWMLLGCDGGAKQRSSINNNLLNAKLICKDLKETFESGAVIKDFGGDRGMGRPDSRMNILMLQIQDKIRSTVSRKETNVAKRDKALAKLKESDDFLTNQIIPKYEQAVKSKKSEDAKALVPLMDQLDKQLNELNDILNS